ncbi:hypothetical protein GCM10022380_70170 [Amycolatopsis tucumanensis]|uniref:Uncharacterized protein n=1 Tax=Amycolatopsis tucumanensis TaxID=401106 RepID=A0ABP7JE23_9PSEU
MLACVIVPPNSTRMGPFAVITMLLPSKPRRSEWPSQASAPNSAQNTRCCCSSKAAKSVSAPVLSTQRLATPTGRLSPKRPSSRTSLVSGTGASIPVAVRTSSATMR